MDIEIEKALNYLRDIANEYSIAKGQADYLKEFRKSKKALLMVEAEMKGINAHNKQETYAYSNDEYIEFLKGYRAAIENEARLRHLMTAAQLKIEVWRSKQATARFERKAYNA